MVLSAFGRSLWVLGFLGAWVFPNPVRSEKAPRPSLADLEEVAQESTLEITTFGRRTGRRHTRPVWFVLEQGKIYLQAGRGGKTDWYLNLQKNPQIELKIHGWVVRGRAHPVEDQAQVEHIHNLFREKYRLARVAQMLGSSIGRGQVVEVDLDLSP